MCQTVGQSPHFIPVGAMTNLVLKYAKIELEIDPEAPDAAGLEISSQLRVVSLLAKAEKKTGGER
jgi:hypothetical protein